MGTTKTLGKTEKYRQIALWLLFPTTSLISHTLLPVPPGIIFFLCSLPFAIFAIDASLNPKAISIEWSIRPTLFAFALYLIYIVLNQSLLQINIRSVFGIVGSALYFPILLILLQGKDLIREHKKKIDVFLVVSLIVYIIEACWRYTVAFRSISSGDIPLYNGIYQYKYGGLMYSESNGTGIHLIVLLFFTLCWVKMQWQRKSLQGFEKKRYIGVVLIWMFLIGLTLSRACWLATGVGLIYFWLSSKINKKNLWITAGIAVLIASAMFIVVVYPYVKHDESFISKFQILYAFGHYMAGASWSDWLFGVGLTRSERVLGIYAHSYILVFIVETGIIGALLMLSIFFETIRISKGETLLIILPFAIATMSTTVTFLPDLYLALAVV